MKHLITCLVIFLLASCTFHTDITYRVSENDEYIREDGYMISCRKEGNYFIVGTYTPDSWGSDFYYDYLEGIRSEKKIIVKTVDLLFVETSDTLQLVEVKKGREFYYSSEHLEHIIDTNSKLRLKVTFLNTVTGQYGFREFLLVRTKHTYPTGTFPHS